MDICIYRYCGIRLTAGRRSQGVQDPPRHPAPTFAVPKGACVRTRGRGWVGHLVVRLLGLEEGAREVRPLAVPRARFKATGPRHGNRCWRVAPITGW